MADTAQSPAQTETLEQREAIDQTEILDQTEAIDQTETLDQTEAIDPTEAIDQTETHRRNTVNVLDGDVGQDGSEARTLRSNPPEI